MSLKYAEQNAVIAIITNSFQFTFILFIYWLTAKAVPEKAGIFKEPTTLAMGRFGSKLKDNGVWIKPPPPTIESTKPATNAMRHNKVNIS